MAYAYGVVLTSYPCCENHSTEFQVPADEMEAGVKFNRTCPGCGQNFTVMVAYEPGNGFIHEWQAVEEQAQDSGKKVK